MSSRTSGFVDCSGTRGPMANGTDSGEFVVLSRVRTGLKREFAFAMKAQSEISGSLGRTRSNKNRNAVQVQCPPASKRSRKSGSVKNKVEHAGGALSEEEEAKSDVVDIDEPNNQVGELGVEAVSENEQKIGHELENSKEEVMDGESGVKEKEGETCAEVEGEKAPRRFTRSTLTKKLDDEEVTGDEGNAGAVAVEIATTATGSTLGKELDDAQKVTSDEGNEYNGALAVEVGDDAKKEIEAAPEMIPTPIQAKKSKTSSNSKKFPSKLKDLLASGILEGLPVNYIRGTKVSSYLYLL